MIAVPTLLIIAAVCISAVLIIKKPQGELPDVESTTAAYEEYASATENTEQSVETAYTEAETSAYTETETSATGTETSATRT